jgi:hypothetical protein
LSNASTNGELHSFVKLAIGYLGIMAGFAALGLLFYEIAAREGPVILSASPFVPSDAYAISVAFFWTLIVILLIGLFALVRNLRIGAYFAFIALVLSIFAPYDKQTGAAPFAVIWWFAIPNAIVGILLLKAFKTLSPASSGIALGRQYDSS